MTNFTISRLESRRGIFRLDGMITNSYNEEFTLSRIEILGTDGWVELNPQDDNVVLLIAQISTDISAHLFSS